jgi:hypothetical protein
MRNRWVRTAATILSLLLTVVVIAGHAAAAEAPKAKAAVTPQKPDGKPGRAVETLGNEHVQSPSAPHIPYNTSPPTSGPHLQWTAKWGVHKTPVLRELQVHNLEDGGVAIQYKCDGGCPDLVAKLEGLAARYAEKAAAERAAMGPPRDPRFPPRSKYDHLIVAPYPDMERQIALTAWGRIDTFDGYDEARITRFIEAYIGIDHHPTKEMAPAAKTP